MTDKTFKLNGDTLVAVDWSNVYGWYDNLGWEIDPARLFEISCDVYNNLNRMKIFMLFSGDGDYAALVRDIIKKGRQAIVVFGPGHKGKEYDDISKGLFLCSVNKSREFIEKK